MPEFKWPVFSGGDGDMIFLLGKETGLSPGQSDLKGGSPTASQAHFFVDNNIYSLLEVMCVTLATQN